MDNGRDAEGRRKQMTKGGFPTRASALSEVTDLQRFQVSAHTASLLDEPAADSVTQSENADVSALLAQEAEMRPEGIEGDE